MGHFLNCHSDWESVGVEDELPHDLPSRNVLGSGKSNRVRIRVRKEVGFKDELLHDLRSHNVLKY